MFDWIAGLFRRRGRQRDDRIQSAFQTHFKNFRALLTANNGALEGMARAEAMLRSGKPFGMTFVRGELTALTVNVFKMIQSLTVLSEGRYRGLNDSFAAVTHRIEAILSRQPEVTGRVFTYAIDEIDRSIVDQVGGKMANLGEMRNLLGIRVPDGFAVTAAAAKHFMEVSHTQIEINRLFQTLDLDDLAALYAVSSEIQELIRATSFPDDLERAIRAQIRDLVARQGKDDIRVALRSSALGEDSDVSSFAGQYRSRLRVGLDEVLPVYRDILAGKYQSQAIVYHQQRGFRHQDVIMCVGCIVMVDARVSGVVYTRPPSDADAEHLTIHAAAGLGDQIVDGAAAYDLLHVERAPPHAASCRKEARPGAGPCLAEAQARELAEVSLRIEAHFGAPQDIEWAIDGRGDLYILQARPLEIAAAAEPEDPACAVTVDAPLLVEGGVTASPGVAAGPVFKVGCALDVLEFPKGAVLVVESPWPEWAVLISRAAGVIGDTGQSATHLATVAREFGIPALFDTGDASARLENGQVVTVCADTRRVFAGQVDALLTRASRRRNLMVGSPIHGLLKEALAYVTPLHLTEPDSPFFKPANCRTLHDITRFCHEKALHEMFNFGRRHGARDKSAKQLYVADSPSQWWVVDLKDGYREGVDASAQFIRIEDIVSEPMRVIWSGMTAIPWEGPPPVSVRGLGAIIAQSAMNPQLDPSVRSNLGDRNYFLVSKKYCNLSVRLGYHFALAEANFSELLNESYVSFQFQGGAADERRRRRRVALLAEMLKELGFRVDIKADALMARIEKRPIPYLHERLLALGYLIIHTRQVDMVMDEEGFIERFRAKIRADIRMIQERAVRAAAEAPHAA
jgi:pyruvate,water dikinase